MLIDETPPHALRTDRLVLRSPRRRDLEAMTELWTDERVARFMDDVGPRAPEAVPGWVADVLACRDDPASVQFVIARSDDDAVVGWLGLGESSAGVAAWSLGYAAHPEHRGQGYLTEALAAALPAVRDRAGIRDLWAECYPDNIASARVMTAAGMREIAPGADGQRRFVWPPTRADDARVGDAPPRDTSARDAPPREVSPHATTTGGRS